MRELSEKARGIADLVAGGSSLAEIVSSRPELVPALDEYIEAREDEMRTAGATNSATNVGHSMKQVKK